MLYLLLCSLVMIVAMVKVHKVVLQMLEFLSTTEGARPNPAAALIPILVAAAYTAPVMTVVLGVLFTGENVRIDATSGRGQIYLLLAGSLVILVTALIGARKAWSDRKLAFWASGRLVILLLAGTVGVLSAYKHLTFFSTDNDGIANVELLRDEAELGDMKACASGVALVQFRDTGPLAYRCPTSVLFNQDSQQPFTPWPDYVEGSSEDLAVAVRDIKAAVDREASLLQLER
ncbi:hypothetical protein M5G27_27750 [Pseudomonas shahriarae]|uniref:Uncharacterized protein n=1 Tax=Pseudomonas shahriarae TaxID=2745512 RepID=A0A9X4HFX7_9PSED|nr:hypothetical protein [Pseudomonas shahriarae]MDD1011269.1 hypothetical protein [Pseudomonas shahriarae]